MSIKKESEEVPREVELRPIVVEGVILGSYWGAVDLTLVDKMLLFECDSVAAKPEQYIAFWQELIDKGVCWDEELPSNYARTAAAFLRSGQCELKDGGPPAPEGWQEEHFLSEKIVLGYDHWDRPPTNPNWGRPFRWKQIIKAQIEEHKRRLREIKNGAIVSSRQCAGCKSKG